MHLDPPDRAGFVDLNRTRLRVWEWGDPADPPVVCLHGAYDHGRMFDGLGPGLAALGFRVVAVDLRGHGDSGRLSSGSAWQASALDIALLIRLLGPPAGLVGHSMGGGQALFVTGVWPELVRWVVTIDGLGPPSSVFDEEQDIVELATRGLTTAVRSVGPPRVYASRAEMVEHRGKINVRLPPAWLEHLVEHGTRPAEGGWTWKVDPVFRVGLPDEFDLDHLYADHAMVDRPVLALTGTEHDTWSDLTEAEVVDRVARLRARHEVVDGAGHYIHVEDPEAVIDAIARFVEELP